MKTFVCCHVLFIILLINLPSLVNQRSSVKLLEVAFFLIMPLVSVFSYFSLLRISRWQTCFQASEAEHGPVTDMWCGDK